MLVHVNGYFSQYTLGAILNQNVAKILVIIGKSLIKFE